MISFRPTLLKWHKKARRMIVHGEPSNVPNGHMVCIGLSGKRFIMHVTYLNHLIFKKLLAETEQEYGFYSQGLLTIPSGKVFFEELRRVMTDLSWVDQPSPPPESSRATGVQKRPSSDGVLERYGDSTMATIGPRMLPNRRKKRKGIRNGEWYAGLREDAVG